MGRSGKGYHVRSKRGKPLLRRGFIHQLAEQECLHVREICSWKRLWPAPVLPCERWQQRRILKYGTALLKQKVISIFGERWVFLKRLLLDLWQSDFHFH